MFHKKTKFNFILRQGYRLLVIWPYEIIIFLFYFVFGFFIRPIKNGKNVYFIITSVIYFSEKGLSYSSVRSTYSPNERIAQTVETINSIKNLAPGAKIILLEAGQKNDLPELKNLVDNYIFLGNDKIVRCAVDSKFKSLGETIMLLKAKKYLPDDAKLFIKISGRYILNENFDLTYWFTDWFKFYFIRGDFVSTGVYSFSGQMIGEWRKALVKSLPYLFLDYPVEFMLYKGIPKKLQEKIAVAGVRGTDATNNAEINE
jgi:hypothetical protein